MMTTRTASAAFAAGLMLSSAALAAGEDRHEREDKEENTPALILSALGEVDDSGPGLPVDARPKVFRRLFRLEAARSTPGSGLGLSLVAAIATLHGIRIQLGDNHPGLRVTLVFPEGALIDPRGSLGSSREVRQDHTLAPD